MASVLIVDDSVEACKVIGKFMTTFGHQVDFADSAGKALAQIQRKLPDLMILDVMMPGMDGMELLGRIRKNPKTKDLPVIVFSAINDPDLAKHLQDHGAQDYWIKGSFDYSELNQRIAPYLKAESQSN